MRGLFSILPFFFLAACNPSKKLATKTLQSGTIEFNIKVEPNEVGLQIDGPTEQTASLSFNNKNLRIDQNAPGMAEEFYIYDLTERKGLNYLAVGDKKYAIKLPEDLKPQISQLQYLDEDLVVAGFKCQKATAIMDGQEIYIYYTKQIAANYFPYLPDFEGFALKYVLNMPYGKIYYTATSVKNIPIENAKVAPPEGFKEVTPFELQREFMASQRRQTIEEAIDFSLKDINGEMLQLSSLRGKVIVLNFWFIACQPCRNEMPDLNALISDFHGEDVVFIGITFDKEKAVRDFLEQTPFKFRILADGIEVIQNYGIEAFPTTIVFDRKGKVVDSITGGVPNIKTILGGIINKGLKS